MSTVIEQRNATCYMKRDVSPQMPQQERGRSDEPEEPFREADLYSFDGRPGRLRLDFGVSENSIYQTQRRTPSDLVVSVEGSADCPRCAALQFLFEGLHGGGAVRAGAGSECAKKGIDMRALAFCLALTILLAIAGAVGKAL